MRYARRGAARPKRYRGIGRAGGVGRTCDRCPVEACIRPAQLSRDAEAVLAVQRAGYALEAQLVGVDALPPQHHTIDDLRGEDLWVAEDSGKIVGVLGVEDGAELVIARLVVDPAWMRRGLGRVLARHALALAGDRFVRVGTAAANTPALALYASLGFELVGERTVGDGLAYVELARRGGM
ncbi:MAG: GNAT family N-acetyltransferase [Actinobacteria bacterium]|nr:MAG: GNAT family N-acetyltransferase [Actinomycetota bacterium]